MKAILATWIILLIFDSLHADDVMVVAHRGASKDAPENTLPAFKLAWEQGADAIEGDFHLTKDGHIVCIHDNNTKKISGAHLVVAESSLAELRRLDVGVRYSKKFKGVCIPTIAEVFATVPQNKTIYIEVKCGIEIVPALVQEIEKSDLKSEQIVIISFNTKVIQELKARAPRFKASWLASVKKDKAGVISPPIDSVLNTLQQIKADGFSSSKGVIGQHFISKIIAKGYDYHVWTIDDAKTAKRFKEWGAKSITTNVPGHLRKVLNAHKGVLEAN